MVKLTVLYGPPSDPAAFDEYYLGTHVPIADAIPGLPKFATGGVTMMMSEVLKET
jgi:uncharacterized protein (TIGR02118 family)